MNRAVKALIPAICFAVPFALVFAVLFEQTLGVCDAPALYSRLLLSVWFTATAVSFVLIFLNPDPVFAPFARFLRRSA
jgi:hypothetical protein